MTVSGQAWKAGVVVNTGSGPVTSKPKDAGSFLRQVSSSVLCIGTRVTCLYEGRVSRGGGAEEIGLVLVSLQHASISWIGLLLYINVSH